MKPLAALAAALMLMAGCSNATEEVVETTTTTIPVMKTTSTTMVPTTTTTMITISNTIEDEFVDELRDAFVWFGRAMASAEYNCVTNYAEDWCDKITWSSIANAQIAIIEAMQIWAEHHYKLDSCRRYLVQLGREKEDYLKVREARGTSSARQNLSRAGRSEHINEADRDSCIDSSLVDRALRLAGEERARDEATLRAIRAMANG